MQPSLPPLPFRGKNPHILRGSEASQSSALGVVPSVLSKKKGVYIRISYHTIPKNLCAYLPFPPSMYSYKILTYI